MSQTPYQICSKCILSNADDSDIVFDNQGVCNHCHLYDNVISKQMIRGPEGEKKLLEIVEKIKRDGKSKEYDCIIGVSGGVDSTYVAYIVKELGLKPLAVHLDNGWDSELAVHNIEGLLNKLNIDLYTYVINWDEFRDLQLSYFKAGVIDIEIPTDHAIMASLYKIARKSRVKYILSGHNVSTEGYLPEKWVHHKFDVLNIRDIHKRFGHIPLKTFPLLSFFKLLFYKKIVGMKMISVLNYLPYEKESAKKLIIEKLGWRDYGGKHYESIFTRFYQAYILPKKFGVDKRRAHLSTLVCSGQLSRAQALEEATKPLYPTETLMNEDKEYVLKKLGFSKSDFEGYMQAPIKEHNDYRSYINIYKKIRPVIKLVKKITGLRKK